MTLVASVEFTEKEARLLIAERGKTARSTIVSAQRFALPQNADDGARVAERAGLLKEALKSSKVKPQLLSIVIPRSVATCRKAMLPSTVDEELVGMARFEAERHLPLNAERHVVAHHVINRQDLQGSEVLIAAVDEPVALEYLEIAVQAGLNVESIGVSTLALYRTFASTSLGENTKAASIALVHIDGAGADIVMVQQGVPVYNRFAPIGADKLVSDLADAAPGEPVVPLERINAQEPYAAFRQITDDAEATAADGVNDPRTSVVRSWLQRLGREIRQSYEFARRETNSLVIETIYLSGPGASIVKLGDWLEQNLGVAGQLWNPLEAIDSSAEASATLSPLGASHWAVALGPLLHAGDNVPAPNLIPHRYLDNKRVTARKRFFIQVAALSAVALVLLYVFTAQRLEHLRTTLQDLESKNKEMQARTADLEAKKTRNSIVRDFIRGQSGPLEVLESVSSFTFVPKDATLTGFEYKKDEYAKVRGHAKNIQAVNAMESALRQTGLFSKVSQDPGSNAPTKIPGRGNETVLAFSMTCEFEKKKPKKSSSSSSSASSSAKADPKTAKEEI